METMQHASQQERKRRRRPRPYGRTDLPEMRQTDGEARGEGPQRGQALLGLPDLPGLFGGQAVLEIETKMKTPLAGRFSCSELLRLSDIRRPGRRGPRAPASGLCARAR